MQIIKKNINDLKKAEYNPRKQLRPGDKEYGKLKKSITEFGYVDPVIWNKQTGHVVGGHQRLQVLKDLGYTEIDCVVIDVNLEKEKALNVALNKISGEWDMPLLGELLNSLNTDMFDLTGFEALEVDTLFPKETTEDDFDVDTCLAKIIEPTVKLGDVYKLGKHRLMCGDATKAADVDKLMAGAAADMVFTDPPYNVNYQGGTDNKLKIKNDNMSDENFYNFLLAAFKTAAAATKPGGAIYICHADLEGYNFRRAMLAAGWMMKQCLVWVKNSMVMGRQDYQWKHEPILYGWKDGAAHTWNSDRKQTTVIEDFAGLTIRQEKGFAILSFAEGLQFTNIKVPSFEILTAGTDEATTVWRIERPQKSSEHPTMKPIALCARAIKNSSHAGEIVLDLFGGSGSTLIAAEQTGRACYAMELDPKYCDVIIKRWEELTGEASALLSK